MGSAEFVHKDDGLPQILITLNTGQQLVQAQLNRLQNQVTVYQSLGGQWRQCLPRADEIPRRRG